MEKRATLIKPVTGSVRTSIHTLPPENFVYGLKPIQDEEGVGLVISKWVTSTLTPKPEIKNKLVVINAKAIQSGCITAKTMHEFAKKNDNLHPKISFPTETSRAVKLHDGPFGIKNVVSDCSMQSIIQMKFNDKAASSDEDYPDLLRVRQRSPFPKPKPTKCSQLYSQSKRTKPVCFIPDILKNMFNLYFLFQVTKPKFIMSKFKNIKGTLNIPK